MNSFVLSLYKTTLQILFVALLCFKKFNDEDEFP